ncbi:hypothetical protein [Streptomyces sp. NPDC004528]|uniref:hypothetical protein n=1 Tax=Streptomyces sp. NPDC004528 TaxID=3154550 RepID=UPI00339E06F3
MQFIVRNGDVVAVVAGGVAIGAGSALADVSLAWWVLWGASVIAVAGARIYRRRLSQR